MRVTLAVLATAFSALWSLPASSATIQRFNENYCKPGPDACVALAFVGIIIPGDAARLEGLIRESPDVVSAVYFNSDGGDPFEALLISDVLNKYEISIITGSCGENDHCAGGVAAGQPVCMSACSLIYLTANTRFGTRVYLHRPTFPSDYFAKLDASAAEAAYNRAVSKLLAGLRERRVPESDIEMMMAQPSVGTVQITPGYPAHAPWMTEWLKAKCGSDPNMFDALNAKSTKEFLDGVIASSGCETDAISVEQRRLQGTAGPSGR